MARPKNGYYLADGQRVPSVTTILHSWVPGGPDALMGWAVNMMKEGKDFREERDATASAGTLAHAAMEAWAHRQAPAWEGPEAIVTKAQRSFGAFLEWVGQTKFRITHTEMPLVSEVHRFGGTMDAAFMNDRRVLADYKTSNAVRPQYLAQVGGGYATLWDEHFPDDPLTGGFVILRFDREYGDFTTKWYPELDAARKVFLHLRALYDIEKELTRRAK